MSYAAQDTVDMTDPATGAKQTAYVTVELFGYKVNLLALQKYFKGQGWKQSDLAEAAGIHQTTISLYLVGKQPIPTKVLDAWETAEYVDADMAETLAATTVQTPPARKSRKPSFARGLNSIPDNGPMPTSYAPVNTAATAAATVTEDLPDGKKLLPRFPVKDAYKLVEMARKANESEFPMTFSLRKVAVWGKAYLLLMAEGYDHKGALSGSFHLAVESKTTDETRTFLRNAFQSIFGFDATVPKEKNVDVTKHPGYNLILPLIRAAIPLWLHGPTGAGKTHTMYEVATDLGRKAFRFQGSGETSVDDLVGGFGLKNGETVFEYGPLPMAMKEGGLLIVDEVTYCNPEVLAELQAVLEGKPLVLKKNRGEVIEPAPGFCIVACDNTLGLGEKPEYVGTQVMNEAFRDRFVFCEFGYMPLDREQGAVERMLNDFAGTQNWALRV